MDQANNLNAVSPPQGTFPRESFRILFVLFFSLSFSTKSPADDRTAAQLLDLSLKAHQYCKHVKMAVHAAIYSDIEVFQKVSYVEIVTCIYLRDGNLLNIVGDYSIQSGVKKSPFHFRKVINKDVLLYTTFRGKTSDGGIGSADVQKRLGHVIDGTWYSGAMDGYYWGTNGRRIISLMKKAADLKLRAQEEDIEGTSCRVVEATTVCGKALVWLSNRHDYLIKRFVLQKGPEDLFEQGMTMQEWNNSKEWPLPDKHRTCSVDLLNSRYERVDGAWVPMEATLLQRNVFSSGKVNVKKFRYKRSNVQFSPTLDPSDFSGDLPEGARVLNDEDPDSGVKYVWRKGTIVPADSEFTGGARFWSGRNLLGVAATAVVGLLLLLASLRYIIKRRKAT